MFSGGVLKMGHPAHAPYTWFASSPTGQAVQLLAPGSLVNPAGQIVQTVPETAPSSIEKLPALQGVHALPLASPVFAEKVPASHGQHQTLPSTSAYFPGSHCLHAEAMESFAYDPGVHTEQFVSPSPRLYVPASHSKQSSATASVVVFENVPGVHAAQAD